MVRVPADRVADPVKYCHGAPGTYTRTFCRSAPTTGPGDHEVEATPAASVTEVPGLVIPRPSIALQVTVAPTTGLSSASCTRTESGCGNGCTTSPTCDSPASLMSFVAAPEAADAVNVGTAPW